MNSFVKGAFNFEKDHILVDLVYLYSSQIIYLL